MGGKNAGGDGGTGRVTKPVQVGIGYVLDKILQAGTQVGGLASSDSPPAAQSFRKQWEDLRMIFDSVPAFVWYKDCFNRILRINRPAAESLGMSVDVIEGCSTYDLYPEEAQKYHEDDLEVIRSGAPKLGIVEVLSTASGEKRWVRTDKVPHRDERGEVDGIIVFSVDITEHMRTEAALREITDGLEQRVEERTVQLANAVRELRLEIVERKRAEERFAEQQSQLAHLQRLRTVEGMATQLAHEINQPLGAIVNFAKGLLRWLDGGKIDPGTVRSAAEHINEQASRAGAVVSRLREFVRKEELQSTLCDLPDVVRDAVHLVETDARRRGITIRINADRSLPPVDINRVQIQQVLINLLTNALEAMQSSLVVTREIVVEAVRRDEGHAEVRVSDAGTGLPAGAEDLFEPFYTTKPDGLGMGLTISQSIILAHGGTLTAEQREGGGATFAFTLPCSPDA
jgi:PAS domain S-box-containing protein